MFICQNGMHNSVQSHRNANVCKQTYDASCTCNLQLACFGRANEMQLLTLSSLMLVGFIRSQRMPKDNIGHVVHVSTPVATVTDIKRVN